MANWSPIAGSPPQYFKETLSGGQGGSKPASGYFIKFYNLSIIPIPMASDGDGSGQLDKCRLDSSGYPLNGSGGRFTPFIDQKYRIAFYQNEGDADNNAISSADWFLVAQNPFLTSSTATSKAKDSISDAKASTGLISGDILQTSGYFSKLDGGGASYFYDAVSVDIENGVTIHALDTIPGRLKLIHTGAIDARQGGVKFDDSTDNKVAFDNITSAFGIFEIICREGIAQVEATNRYSETVMNEPVPAGIRMFKDQILTIEAGATIKQVEWMGPGGANDDAGFIIMMASISNIMIRGKGTIVGNFPPGSSQPGRATDSNSGINVANSNDVIIKDLTIKDCFTDGLVVTYFANVATANNCKNVSILNVTCKENRRNGCAVAGCTSGAIIGGLYSDNVGTSPESGIDLEPNSGITNIIDGSSLVEGFTVTGVTTKGNRRSGINIGAPNSTDRSELTNVVITGNTFNDRLVAERIKHCIFTSNECGSELDDPDVPSDAFDAMQIVDCTDCVISSNIIDQARGNGISLQTKFSVGGVESAITNVTQANPALVTSPSHGFIDGERVYIDEVDGMTQLNNKRFTIAASTTSTYELLDTNSTSFTPYTANGRASNSRLCDDHIVSGNVIRNAGKKADATYSGIRIEGSKNHISSNSCRPSDSGNNPIYGFRLSPSAEDNHLIINDGSGFREIGRKGWIDQGVDNTIIGFGNLGSKKILINTLEDAAPSSANPGVMIDEHAISLAFTGNGAKDILTAYDGFGVAGKLTVDGSQHLDILLGGVANGASITTDVNGNIRFRIANNVNSPILTCFDGAPNGNVTANPGSLCLNITPLSGQFILYAKESGTGSSNWQGIGTALP